MARSLPQIRGRVILKPRPEDYRSLPSFGYFNLTQLARSDPAVYAAVTSTPRPSTPPEDPESSKKKTKAPRKPTDPEKPVPDAVGYTPQPPMSPGRPQRLCAICSTPIAHGEGQDFTGNLPCRHRGTCSSRFCILAYYGSLDRWALPYTGLMPIYCRAPGCGAKVEAWCQVRCRESDGGVGKVAHTDSYRDPKVVKAEEKRRHRELQRERKASGRGSWPLELRSGWEICLDRLGQVLCVACCFPCICAAELCKDQCMDCCLALALFMDR